MTISTCAPWITGEKGRLATKFLKALIRKDPHAAKLAMWQHLENTKLMLFNETSDDFEFNADRYLFAENPVVHLDTGPTAQNKRLSSCQAGCQRLPANPPVANIYSVSLCKETPPPAARQSAKSTSNRLQFF